MVHIYSKDGGETFTQPVRISADNWAVNGCPHTGPAMTSNRAGLHFAWFTMGGGEGVFYSKSINNGITFSGRESISARPTAKHPQLAAMPTGDLLLTGTSPQTLPPNGSVSSGNPRREDHYHHLPDRRRRTICISGAETCSG